MKLTLILICCIGLLGSMAENSYAQSAKLTLDLKNATIKDVLLYIENHSEFAFMYDNNKVDVTRKVDINVKEKTIDTILELLFDKGQITYQTMGRHIIIVPKENSTGRFTNQQQPQQKTVSGKVTDTLNQPLPGVTVMVKGTSQGTITNADGGYSIASVTNGTTLQFSFVGMKTQEVIVGSQTSINVIMQEETIGIEEVVAVGYGTMEKKQVTSSVTTLSSEKLIKGIGGSSVAASMKGLVGGLVIAGDDSPNSDYSLQLRGLTSINAGKSPLIVIDGFAGGDFKSLQQEDILSIDVLKDASAGAIYGTRAASGVILITTKSASNTGNKVHVTYENEFFHKQSYRDIQMIGRDEYVEKGLGTDYGADTDWYGAMINNNNFSHKHHFSLMTGGENASIYTSLSYAKNQGISIRDEREDISARSNASFSLFDKWVDLKINFDYRQESSDSYRNSYGSVSLNAYAQALVNNPTRPIYNPDDPTGFNIYLFEWTRRNTVSDAYLIDNNGLKKWIKPVANLKVNIKPVEGLSANFTMGYENIQNETHRYVSQYYTNLQQESMKGAASLGFSKTETVTLEGYGSYIRDFGKHVINAVAGYSWFEKNGEGFSMENYNFTSDALKYWDIGSGTSLAAGSGYLGSGKDASQKLLAYFMRTNYSYDEKYLAAVSIRREGSSKFAKNNRWGNFWSISAGWRISKENFMKDVEWVNDLKLRVGYGVTGNNNFSSYYMANLLGSDTWWKMPDGTWKKTYGKSQNVNDELGWEEKGEINLGLDYSLFNNRLYGKIDVYKRIIDNMIYTTSVPVPPYITTSMYRNIGQMQSKGIEVEIGGNIVNKKDFSYSSNVILSSYSAKINTLYGDQSYLEGNMEPYFNYGGLARIEAGTTIGQFYFYKFAGFAEDGTWLLYDKDDNVIPAAEKQVSDKRYIGNYTPKLMATWNHNLSYKNFDLGVNLRSWIDFDIFNTYNMFTSVPFAQRALGWNVQKGGFDKYGHINATQELCDYWLEDGTFLKIDAITLGYNLPIKNRWTKHIQSIRFYGTAGNVCTITGYSGVNPEVNITGWEGGTDWYHTMYPYTRTFTFGMQFKFL